MNVVLYGSLEPNLIWSLWMMFAGFHQDLSWGHWHLSKHHHGHGHFTRIKPEPAQLLLHVWNFLAGCCNRYRYDYGYHQNYAEFYCEGYY